MVFSGVRAKHLAKQNEQVQEIYGEGLSFKQYRRQISGDKETSYLIYLNNVVPGQLIQAFQS